MLRNHGSASPSVSKAPAPDVSPRPAPLPLPCVAAHLYFQPPALLTPVPSAHPRRAPEAPFSRCSVKGCIFPAANTGGRLCLIHDLTEKEPNHFLSVQPSLLCLERAKYGIAETDYDDTRARDRKRLSIQLDQFRNDVA